MISKLSLLLFLIISCEQTEYSRDNSVSIISADTSKMESSSAGNLVASAIRLEHQLDFVFYPKTLLKTDQYAFSLNDEKQILNIYPDGTMDQFYIGNMSGRDVKSFLFERTLELYNVELEVAGLKYHFMFDGGFPLARSVVRADGGEIKEDQNYKVAISKHYFFSGETFPSYKFRNSIERKLKNHFVEVSAKEALRNYLSDRSKHKLIRLDERRAVVEYASQKKYGLKKISQVQGKGHLSPYLGDTVTVRAVVTAKATVDWYPGGEEFYLQEEEKDWDNDPRTSEGIHLYIDNVIADLEVGDLVEVTAEVYEQMTSSKMSRTQLRNLKSYKVLKNGLTLPGAIPIGPFGRKIPTEHISTYTGDNNFKPKLNLKDGLDFWESLEGMRIEISNPTIVGFRGGKESSDPFDKKDHLTLYLTPETGGNVSTTRSPVGGILPLPEKNRWNPQIVAMPSSNLAKDLDTERAYNVGEILEGRLVGILQYNKNLFGGGEYGFALTDASKSTNYKNLYSAECLDGATGVVKLECRPKSQIETKWKKLTVAAYNLKNLSGLEPTRIEETAKMFATNLNCPDIIGLVEVQDDNGLDFSGASSADKMLTHLSESIPCVGKVYRYLNIDPLTHTEGGQPGGNIRVAILYDSKKVNFTPRGTQAPFAETIVENGGELNNNPGRVYPMDDIFRNTRKSIIAKFEFQGEDIYLIVNHFNSKLGDASHWGPVHPVIYGSEKKRAKIAYRLNKFVRLIERRNTKANIIVLGDFNANLNEGPMKILEGTELFNLLRTLPKDRHYTSNHNGNSQSLDYIFINKVLQKRKPEFDVLHLNSDFMGRLSDHDPVLSGFSF